MKTIKIILVSCFVISCFSSCKKMAKSFSKEIASETVEKSTKQVGEEVVYGVGEKAIKKMDVDELIEFIRKNNGPLANSFEKIDKSIQKNIKKAIDEDVNFLNYLLCSNTLLDDFGSLVKNAPKASRDINLLKMYAKSTFDARRYGKKNLFKDLSIKETDGVTIFIHRLDNTEYARLRDGIVEFSSNGNDINKIVKAYVFDNDLLPNSVYKVKGQNGASYILNVDGYGRVHNIKFTGDIREFDNIIKSNQDIFLGDEWDNFIKESAGSVKGHYDISLNYQTRSTSPCNIDIKSQKGKGRQKKTFQNIHQATSKVFCEDVNAEFMEKYIRQMNISSKRAKELLEAMNDDDGLARLIHQNPEKNIQRWLNTRNPVDKSKLAVTSKGQYPRNAETYAGNVYYFNPHLNEGLMMRLKDGAEIINIRGMDGLSYEDLMMLDKLYPDGVPFTKEGFPDFSKVAYKGKDGKILSVNVGNIGESTKDIGNANKIFKEMGYDDDGGYTWHHIEETTSLMRVPFIIHGLVDHSGGISMAKI